jgi:hypothetical protein
MPVAAAVFLSPVGGCRRYRAPVVFHMLACTRSRFHEIRIRLESHAPTSPGNGFCWELFLFTIKRGGACLFGAVLLGLLLLTKSHWPAHALPQIRCLQDS